MENRVPVVSTRAIVFFGVLLCLCAAEAARGQTPLRVVSSGFLRETLQARLFAALSEAHSDLSLDWRDAGSRGALCDLFEGGADVAVTIQRVRPDEIRLAERLELELHEHAVALDLLALVVHPDNAVESMSPSALDQLFRGSMLGWYGVGGMGTDVIPIATRALAYGFLGEVSEAGFAARLQLVESESEVLARVAAERGGIGLVSVTRDQSAVRTVPIEVEPNVVRTSGPLARTLWAYSLGSFGSLRSLLDFLRLQEGRRVLEDAGLHPLLAATHRGPERETVRAFLTRVTFGFEGFRLRAAARQVLDGLAKSLKSPRQSVWIVGHVEPTESVDQDDLSLLRAREIANYLQQKGIDPSRMTVEGVGASEPLTDHRTLEGRRESRRAEIWVLPQR